MELPAVRVAARRAMSCIESDQALVGYPEKGLVPELHRVMVPSNGINKEGSRNPRVCGF